MKKIICILLTVFMLLGLCACADSGGTAKSAGLQAGFARVNITPDYPVSMAGYGNYDKRISTGYTSYLYATCIAVTDGNDTVLIYTLDLTAANSGTLYDQMLVSISSATNIPMDKIFIGATHTHGAPAPTYDSDNNPRFKNDLLAAVAQIGNEALNDMADCQMLQTDTQVKGMNFVRHYKVADGTYYGSNFGDKSAGLVGHVREPDDQLILLKFDREGDKKDILFVNWQAHPDHTAWNDYTALTSDFVGVMRDALEQDTGMLVGYYGGASGDLNPFSSMPEVNHGLNMTQYGEKMAQYAQEALAGLKPVEGTAIKTARKTHTFEINHRWDHLITQAREVSSLNAKSGRDAATKLALEYGMSSVYHANAIISQVSMGLTEDRVLDAFCIGDIGFIQAKCEMFSASAKYIKENSPFTKTIVIASNSTYIPTEEAYSDYRCYESDTSLFVQGSAEKMNDDFLQMLNSLK